MELKLDEVAIKAAIDKTMTGAVEEALGRYAVREAVAKVITEEVATGAIALALQEAVKALDSQELVKTLAREIARSVTSATVRLTQEGIVHTVGVLRGVRDFDTSETKAKAYAAIRADLFGKAEPAIAVQTPDTPF